MSGYGGALLTGFYAAVDRKDWAAVAALLTADVRWHVLANDRVEAALLVGRDAVVDWLTGALGDAQDITQTLTAVHDEGTAAAVFTTAVVTRGGQQHPSAWVDTFRFADGLISEHVGLQVG